MIIVLTLDNSMQYVAYFYNHRAQYKAILKEILSFASPLLLYLQPAEYIS